MRCAEAPATGTCPNCKFKLCTGCRAEEGENSRCPRCFAKEGTGREWGLGGRPKVGTNQPREEKDRDDHP